MSKLVIKTLIVLAVISISCAVNENRKNEIKADTSDHVNIPSNCKGIDKNKIELSKFIDIPSDMIGECGVSLFRNDKDYIEQEYIWYDNSTKGIIIINGIREFLNAEFENNTNLPVFRNTNYEIRYEVKQNISTSNESTEFRGALIIKKISNNDSIIVDVIGVSGC